MEGVENNIGLPSRSSVCIGHQSSPQTGAPALKTWAVLPGKKSAVEAFIELALDDKRDVHIMWDWNISTFISVCSPKGPRRQVTGGGGLRFPSSVVTTSVGRNAAASL